MTLTKFLIEKVETIIPIPFKIFIYGSKKIIEGTSLDIESALMNSNPQQSAVLIRNYCLFGISKVVGK